MKVVLYLLVFFLVFLSFGELTTRLIGYKPNLLLNSNEQRMIPLKIVDSIKILDVFQPDSLGLMKINLNNSFQYKNNKSSDILRQYSEYILDVHLNNYGFRGRDFDSRKVLTKKKILLVGDSFTWGYTARPIDSCFANLLESDTDFLVYNASVPGSDIASYKVILEKYTPIIKPDLIIVNYFIANDLVVYNKVIRPFEFNDIYPTNAGPIIKLNMESIGHDSVEVFRNHIDAYNYFLSRYTFTTKGGLFNLLGKSSFFSYCYRNLIGFNKVIDNRTLKIPKDKRFTFNSIKRMHDVSEVYKSKLIFSIIPSLNDLNKNSILNHVKENFPAKVQVVFPSDLKTEDYYPMPDMHFNNKGHKKYYRSIKLEVLNFLP